MDDSLESVQWEHGQDMSVMDHMIAALGAEELERQQRSVTSQAPQEVSSSQTPSQQRASAQEPTQSQDPHHAGMTPPSSFRDDPEPSLPQPPLKRRRVHDATDSDTRLPLQELASATQPWNAGRQTSQPRVSRSKQAPGFEQGALQQPPRFPHAPTRETLGETPQPAGQMSLDAEELGLAIRGRYKSSSGEDVAVAAEALPLTILQKAVSMIKRLDEQHNDWRGKDCSKCLRLSQGTRTSFRWPKDDGPSASCQTCANLHEICCRYEADSKTLIVAALPRCVRLDVAVSEEAFWLRERSERKTDSKLWR